MDEEKTSTGPPVEQDKFKDAIEEQLSKIRRQSILIGAQTVCTVILDKINTAKNQPGKFSMRDHERLLKDIEKFCTTGIKRRVNADGTVTETEEE